MNVLASISLLSFGSWAILCGLFRPDIAVEVFLGMVAPWLTGVLTLWQVRRLHRIEPRLVTAFMVKAFWLKLVFYGLYVTLIVALLDPRVEVFAISLVSYFVVLHLTEALHFRWLFQTE
ncbi:MAG: hypothetical protein ACE5JX_00190 [Acidobacteriota bacterium]